MCRIFKINTILKHNFKYNTVDLKANFEKRGIIYFVLFYFECFILFKKQRKRERK